MAIKKVFFLKKLLFKYFCNIFFQFNRFFSLNTRIYLKCFVYRSNENFNRIWTHVFVSKIQILILDASLVLRFTEDIMRQRYKMDSWQKKMCQLINKLSQLRIYSMKNYIILETQIFTLYNLLIFLIFFSFYNVSFWQIRSCDVLSTLTNEKVK